MSRKTTQIILLLILVSFCLTGCGTSRMLLKKKQKELGLKLNEGGVVFSFYLDSSAAFQPTSVIIQEINQYKEYGKKKIAPVQITEYRTYSKMYLLNMKLPQGTYNLVSFGGILGGFWGTQFYIPCNKVFDVLPGEINYAGRVKATMFPQGNNYQTSITIDNFHEEDVSLFLSNYPILQGKKVNKDLMY